MEKITINLETASLETIVKEKSRLLALYRQRKRNEKLQAILKEGLDVLDNAIIRKIRSSDMTVVEI